LISPRPEDAANFLPSPLPDTSNDFLKPCGASEHGGAVDEAGDMTDFDDDRPSTYVVNTVGYSNKDGSSKRRRLHEDCLIHDADRGSTPVSVSVTVEENQAQGDGSTGSCVSTDIFSPTSVDVSGILACVGVSGKEISLAGSTTQSLLPCKFSCTSSSLTTLISRQLKRWSR
jgi:hypothetical protein